MRETLERSNLGLLKVGDEVNVERSMLMNGRLDGHIVQGHVDQTAVCIAVEDQQGSHQYTFKYESTKEMVKHGYFTVDKGSVTVNGVSLTVCRPTADTFQVCIIPYTFDNTNFHQGGNRRQHRVRHHWEIHCANARTSKLINSYMKRVSYFLILLFSAFLNVQAGKHISIWPKGKMPDAQPQQIAAMTAEVNAKGFNPDKARMPYLEWMEKPQTPNGCCMILISGGGYFNTCDNNLISLWTKRFTELGFQCVNFVYRTPRPEGLPIYKSAWEDGQRAVRMVRSEAKKRGFDPEKIGTISMSAGSHLALLLATSSQTPAYARVDNLDDVPCHVNFAIVNAPAYALSDSEGGTPNVRLGYGPDVKLDTIFHFDEKTCPMSLHHGGNDPYSPNASTQVFRQLRKRKIPAELHLYPGKGHGAFGLERGIEFLTQMGLLGPVQPEVEIMKRFPNDNDRDKYVKENIWPDGKMPYVQENQGTPYIEWHIPANLKTKAIQIIYSGGSYMGNGPDGFEVAPARRYLNSLGMAVVTMRYRTPRPAAETGLKKHISAWQDLQRAIRVVKSKAADYGLDPNNIGIMGSSAGGHLTLMGVTSSVQQAYLPIDNLDKQPCNVQWGIGIYPAYALTDGDENHNTTSGTDDSAVLVPEFNFDLKTAPMLFVHGDKDGWASMNSVKTWEKMRAMGIQSELHILATRDHCFQRTASPGTGSYTYLERISEFLKEMKKL